MLEKEVRSYVVSKMQLHLRQKGCRTHTRCEGSKGVTEYSNKRTTASSYGAAVKGSTEDLEAKMQKMNLAAKSNMQVNMVEVSESKASEEAIRQEEVNKIAFQK